VGGGGILAVKAKQINVNIFKEAQPQQRRRRREVKAIVDWKMQAESRTAFVGFRKRSSYFSLPIFLFSVAFCCLPPRLPPLAVAFSILLYMQIWHFVATAAIDSSRFPSSFQSSLRYIFQFASAT